MATISSGPKGRLALLLDEASQQRVLVNTGCSYSITYVAVYVQGPGSQPPADNHLFTFSPTIWWRDSTDK